MNFQTRRSFVKTAAAAALATVAVLAIVVLLLAVLSLVVVNALAHSPWGTFSLAATVPIALLTGCCCAGTRAPCAG